MLPRVCLEFLFVPLSILLHSVQGPVQGRLCPFGFAGIYIQTSSCIRFTSLLLGLMAGSISMTYIGLNEVVYRMQLHKSHSILPQVPGTFG